VFWLITNEWRFEEIVAEFKLGAPQNHVLLRTA
jgi:hypothetical protein